MNVLPVNIANRHKNYLTSKPAGTVAFCAKPVGGIKKIVQVSSLGLSMLFIHPSNFAQDIPKFNPFAKIIPKGNELTEEVVKGLNIIEEINFRGGKTFKFDSVSVEKLRQKILKSPELITYSPPIRNSKNVYLCDFGMFGAKRPGGRPHMGLDVFVTPNARKPEKPVPILSPIEGVVIANKKANPNDNVVANSVGILGVDGIKYSFDHMARAEDYPAFKAILMPQVGQIVKLNDTLGYVGKTGETDLWHLHFTVMTQEGLKNQLADSSWINKSKKSPYTALRGQVNPLDSLVAGKIAKVFNVYRKVK